jgi:hypothetical protein
MPEARPADPLSIVSLAAGIASLVLAVFSVLPMVAMCLLPISALCALTGLVTGVISAIRTTLKPELDGRQQALMGLALSLVWVGAATTLAMFAARSH